jgi:hypothetical protein
VAGTQPSSAISWQPLQTPSDQVSGRARQAWKAAHTASLNRMVPAQPLAESSTSA